MYWLPWSSDCTQWLCGTARNDIFQHMANDCVHFCSIILTAFLGTSVIFACFTLSALYAKRRSYLFLGGKHEKNLLVALVIDHVQVFVFWPVTLVWFIFLQGTLMSGLTVLLLVSVFNMFFASEILFKVCDVTVWKRGMKLCDSLCNSLLFVSGSCVSGSGHHVWLCAVWHAANHWEGRNGRQRLHLVRHRG